MSSRKTPQARERRHADLRKVLAKHPTFKAAAQEMGVPESTVYRWRKEMERDELRSCLDTEPLKDADNWRALRQKQEQDIDRLADFLSELVLLHHDMPRHRTV